MSDNTKRETAPKRIQRKRTKGWRMPAGAVYVGQATKWGNLFPSSDTFRWWLETPQPPGHDEQLDTILRDIEELRGKDLACWCLLDCCCHADVLLEFANR